MSALDQGESIISMEVETISPGEQVELAGGYIVRPFATHHRIISQGYALFLKRKLVLLLFICVYM